MAPAREEVEEGAYDAALRFARRRRIGPYAETPFANDREGRDARQKAAAAMLRAGHGLDLVRRILDASPGDVPDPDSC
jgi:regulatory protein